MYGCMPISPDIVDDAESLTTFPPFKAASAERNLACQNPNHPCESLSAADVPKRHYTWFALPRGVSISAELLG